MTQKPWRILACLAAFSALSGCGTAAELPVARVAGNEITTSELNHWLAAQDRASSGRADHSSLRRQALDFLISAWWTIGEARQLGITVTDQEARQQLELYRYVRLEKLNFHPLAIQASSRPLLDDRKATTSDRLWLVTLSMLAARIKDRFLQQAKDRVTHRQIVGYYKEHRQRFIAPERRDLEIIETYTAAPLAKAKREIEDGDPFVSVAKRLTIDPRAPTGLEPAVTRGLYGSPSFNRIVFAARPHVLYGPIHGAVYYMFRITKITRARQQTLAEVRLSIRERLAAQMAATTLTKEYERRWLEHTTCAPHYDARRCRHGQRRRPSATGRAWRAHHGWPVGLE